MTDDAKKIQFSLSREMSSFLSSIMELKVFNYEEIKYKKWERMDLMDINLG